VSCGRSLFGRLAISGVALQQAASTTKTGARPALHFQGLGLLHHKAINNSLSAGPQNWRTVSCEAGDLRCTMNGTLIETDLHSTSKFLSTLLAMLKHRLPVLRKQPCPLRACLQSWSLRPLPGCWQHTPLCLTAIVVCESAEMLGPHQCSQRYKLPHT